MPEITFQAPSKMWQKPLQPKMVHSMLSIVFSNFYKKYSILFSLYELNVLNKLFVFTEYNDIDSQLNDQFPIDRNKKQQFFTYAQFKQ